MCGIINIYCDESCHLEHSLDNVMTLGAIWCRKEKAAVCGDHLREIKKKHGLSPDFEIKWVKVSPAKVMFYLEVLDYFFDCEDLHFRALIILNKDRLDHAAFGQSHDDWYYKMYFNLLKAVIDPEYIHHIYLDYKDTWGKKKAAKLHEVLSNAHYDFSREIIEKLQIVRSHEVELIQLTDLLTGAISYANRGLSSSRGKVMLFERVRERSGYKLTETTLLRENKLNLFCWHAQETGQ